MNYIKLSVTLLFFSATCFSQANYNITDPERSFKEAKEFFIKHEYSIAYPLLKELRDHYPENTESRHAYLNQDINYYYIVCGLKLEQSVAEDGAQQYIEAVNNEPRQQLMSYNLARYFYRRGDFARAIVYFERAGYDNLSNEEIADAKFELAYSYFNLKQFDKAKPLFNEIHQLPENKYYYDANYYYGFISFRDRDYAQALDAFKKVENRERYKALVPYYIADIYYARGQKEDALRYGQEALLRDDVYYKKDLNLLIGQIYFEKKEFARALPLLEAYVNSSDKVSKEVMYELSYAYYDGNQIEKAIEGFKQLSGEKDSLGQNSMYLLGDLYLRTNQKANARNAFLYSANNSSNRKQQEISRFNYAKLSYELGYQDIALAEMNRFLDLYPSSEYAVEAKEILINLLANTNDYDEAIALYESFDKPTPAMQKVYPKILFGKATTFINDGKTAQADEILTRIIRDPNAGQVLPYAYFWKGETSYKLGRYDEAIRNMNAYLDLGGYQGEATPSSAKYVLGYAYIQNENWPLALASFKDISSALTPQSGSQLQDAYVRTADSYFMMKNYGSARSMYQNVIDKGLPQSDYALYQLAVISGINNPAEKIKALNAITQRYPQSDLVAESYLQIANTYMAQEKFNDALPYLKKILEIPGASGQYPKVYLKLGLSYYNMNANNEALQNYQKLVSQYPQSEEADEAMENIRNIYVELGQPNEYVDFAKKAGKVISVSEADSLTYTAAELKYAGGDCQAAIAAFSDYLSRYPAGAYAIQSSFYRSECYVKNKDWKNAAEGYEKVLSFGNNKYAERAALAAARTYYLELQDYEKAKAAFIRLKGLSTDPQNELEALRGLVRSYYQTKDFSAAITTSQELLTRKGLSTDDKAIANLVLGKSLQINGKCDEAINTYRQAAAINKSAWGAEARYEIANCYLTLNDLANAEKAGMEVIKVTGSYDYWVAKAYILLGDVYLKQKDYFNAKATFQSVADNATIPELKTEAKEKLDRTISEEQQNSKVATPTPSEK